MKAIIQVDRYNVSILHSFNLLVLSRLATLEALHKVPVCVCNGILKLYNHTYAKHLTLHSACQLPKPSTTGMNSTTYMYMYKHTHRPVACAR